MRFSVAKALLCVLGLTQITFSAPVYQYTDISTTPERFDLPNREAANEYEATFTERLASSIKRANAQRPAVPRPVLSQKPGWDKTWFAYVEESANSGWTKETIKEMAKKAYQSRLGSSSSGYLLVAALWVKGEGAWFGTAVQGTGEEALKAEAPIQAPQLWNLISGRRLTGNSATARNLFHAEDAAMFWYESNGRTGARPNPYPASRTYMAIFGTRGSYDSREGDLQEPCGGPMESIRPSCDFVLAQLRIAVN